MWAALAAAPALVPSWDGLCASRHQDFLTEYWQKRPLLIRGLLSPEEVEALCPLTPDDLVDLAGDADVCSRLVLETGGAQPWEYDVILMHTTPTTWTFKRDARISRPLADILWIHDGIAHLRPEVQLLHKARAVRPQDQVDFDVCAPLLDEGPRSWLREALTTAHPGHPWLDEL